MRQRVLQKISGKFLDLDALIIYAVTHGYWSELDGLQEDMQKLKRRWPKVYHYTFFGIDFRLESHRIKSLQDGGGISDDFALKWIVPE